MPDPVINLQDMFALTGPRPACQSRSDRRNSKRAPEAAPGPLCYGRIAAIHLQDCEALARTRAVHPCKARCVPASSGNARLRYVSPGSRPHPHPKGTRGRGREPLRLHYATKTKIKNLKVKIKTGTGAV